MSKSRFHVLVIIAAIALFAGCATPQPVYNVSAAPVTSSTKKDLTTDDVSKAILRAGATLGWEMTPGKPGHITGTLKLRNHVAVVDIDYNAKSYSIKHRESTNLNYDGTNIHKNYNSWVQNLEKGIRNQIASI